jgi:hypothetical protein
MLGQIDILSSEIRKIYALSPMIAPAAIEELLKGELEGLEKSQKLAFMSSLMDNFSESPPPQSAQTAQCSDTDANILKKLLPMMIGRDVSNMAPEELSEKLMHSINTVFDSLNQLTGLINSTLGNAEPGDETIRHIIGSTLESEIPEKSLEEHLGQIKKAFLITQQAFKEASKSVLSNVLVVLDPKQMEPSQSGLKIGPLKKAESFEIYEEKYQKCKKWFDSGRFIEDLIRQFEKNCQKIFSENRR